MALCFIAVLGIVLASYLAVCSRSMNLSNRSFQAGLGQQLAEFGLEEGLRAFNKNDWANWSANGLSATWSDWTVGGVTRKACTVTFSVGKFGQGISATVKIRIDNPNAAQVGASWASGLNYQVNDLIGDAGIWYRCIKNHTSGSSNRPVNYNYWVPEGLTCIWDSTTPYAAGDFIVYNEVWYRCTTGNTNRQPPNASYWHPLVAIYTTAPAWPYVSGSQEAALFTSGSLVRLTNSTWDSTPPYTWQWIDSQPYKYNEPVYYNGVWYRCLASHTSSWWPNNTSNTSLWSRIESIWAWNSSFKYNLGDVVYYTKWYRCIKAGSGQAPSDTSAYWSNVPVRSSVWDLGRRYSAADTVTYNGTWYLCLVANNNSNPSTNATNWANATDSANYWSSTNNYTGGSYASYGGVWYKCRTTNTGQTPNNTTYWTAAWRNSFQDSAGSETIGSPVIYAESTISIAGNPPIKTQIRATLGVAPLFPNAVGATGDLAITTGTGRVDSYDYNSGLTYSAQANSATNYSAVLASGATLSIHGTTTVRGYLAWPTPASGISSNTTVWGLSSPAAPKVDSSHISRSPFIPQFDTLPSPGLMAAFSLANFPKGVALESVPGGVVNIGTPGATTPSRYYFDNDLSIASSTSYDIGTLNINGPVILYINGFLRIRSGGSVYVTSTGSAEIHVGTYLRIDTGSNGFINRAPSSTNPDPKKLIIIADNSGTSTQNYDDTTNDFYGLIYMPKTTATNGLAIGTAGTGAVFYGAISAKKVTFTNEATIHYDTSLRYAAVSGVDQPYAVTEWRELPIAEQATMP